MYGYVYKTTNLVNGKIYIGQHKAKVFDKYYYGSGYSLKKAFKKYKPKRINFKCEVLEWCETKEVISEREKYWVTFYDAKNPEVGYNLADGGQGCYDGSQQRGLTGKLKIVKDGDSKFVDFEDIYTYFADGWVLVDKSEAKRRSNRKWKQLNKAKVKADKKQWYKDHPDLVRLYNKRARQKIKNNNL